MPVSKYEEEIYWIVKPYQTLLNTMLEKAYVQYWFMNKPFITTI